MEPPPLAEDETVYEGSRCGEETSAPPPGAGSEETGEEGGNATTAPDAAETDAAAAASGGDATSPVSANTAAKRKWTVAQWHKYENLQREHELLMKRFLDVAQRLVQLESKMERVTE